MTKAIVILLSVVVAFIARSPSPMRADELTFLPHVIKPARPGAKDNTVPSMVWLDDVDGDGQVDLIACHVAWMTEKGHVYPYTAWYRCHRGAQLRTDRRRWRR